MRPFAALGVLTLLALLGALVATHVTADQRPDVAQLERAGQARAGDPGPVLAQVDGLPITTADLAERIAIVQANLDYMRQEAATGGPQADFLQEFARLIESAGVENAALGSLIVDRALMAEAQRRGLAPTGDEVARRVAQDRALAPQVDDPRMAAYIAVIGEERYWTVVYPATVQQELAAQRLWEAETGAVADPVERQRAWTSVQARIIGRARVTLVRPDLAAPATLEGALAYLQRYWELYSNANR
uniref:SurA N-terminal domain-containing protein n=1 Tax=Thermorudis peleae TaxID=1382356 RepID=A0A831THH6_9BACT